VAFRIGDTSVTTDDVDQRIERSKPVRRGGPGSDDGADTFRRDAANSMAVQIMLEDEADQRGIAVAGNEVSDARQVLIDQRYREWGTAGPIGFNEFW
jgi:peptidyl-prolyl cis-trans isomerase C